MKDLSVDWAEYARVQEELKQSKTSNDRHWGLENALNQTLDDIEKGCPFDRSDVERRIQSGARRNRHRSRLVRLQPVTWQPDTVDPAPACEARSELIFLRDALDADGFELVHKIAEGYNYTELESEEGAEVSTLRKRVSRCRAHARRLFPEE